MFDNTIETYLKTLSFCRTSRLHSQIILALWRCQSTVYETVLLSSWLRNRGTISPTHILVKLLVVSQSWTSAILKAVTCARVT
jgi:hypothetical protein